MDPEMEEVFRTFELETREQLEALDQGFLALEADPDDRELVATIFRHAHTMKGNAGALGFDALAEMAHALESALDRIRRREVAATPARINLFLETLDALRNLVTDSLTGVAEPRPGHAQLLARLAEAAAPAEREESVAPLPENAPAEAQAGEGAQVETRTLRVDVARLDELLRLAGEIAIAQNRIGTQLREVNTDAAGRAALVDAHEGIDTCWTELRAKILALRMVSIAPMLRQFARTVRDTAASVSKLARLVVEDDGAEMDTALVEKMKGPLTHMIRNAIDHGLESPVDRVRLGKDSCGVITMRARRDGSGIVIEVGDDGRGLDRNAIAARAKSLGVANADELTDAELYAMIFGAGFSTSRVVTGLSGRGVGMDVVKATVESLRGTISIDSRPGEGTTFHIRLPLTVAIIEGLAVKAEGETYIVPLDDVTECFEHPADARGRAHGVLQIRGAPLPFFRLRDLFRIDGRPAERETVVSLSHGDASAALVVDELVGVQEVVMKSPTALFRDHPGLAGSTIVGSGRVALVLDVPELLRMATRTFGVSTTRTDTLGQAKG